MYLKSLDLCNIGNIVYTKQNLTRGGKIFLAFLLLEYIFPLILNLLFDIKPLFRLHIYSLENFISVLIIILTCIIAIIVSSYTPSILPKNKNPIKPIPKWLINIISLTVILVGLSVFLNDFSQWRYEQSLSENRLAFFASIFQAITPFLIFWILMTDHKFILSRRWSDIITKGILFLATIFSINGLGAIFVTLISALIFFAPQSIIDFFYGNSKKTYFIKNNFNKIILLSFLILLFIPISKISLYTKSGNSSFESISTNYLDFEYLVNRHSVHLSALSASIEDGPELSYLKIPFETAKWRLEFVTGTDYFSKKPEIASLNRISLLQFADFDKINTKGGSSPGLLGGITMIFSFPTSILLVFLITFFYIKIIDFILCRQPPFTWFGAFVFAYIPLRNATDSPFDLIIPGPVTIILFLLFIFSLRRVRIN